MINIRLKPLFRGTVRLVAGILLFGLIARSQDVNGVQCDANAATAPILPLRSEGQSELLPDLVFICASGKQTASGTTNITVTLNTGITSKILDSKGTSEALLLIDEPQPGNQQLGVNVFQGTFLPTSNQVTFTGIPVLPPSTSGVYRIANIRANASALNTSFGSAPLVETVSGGLGTFTGVVGIIQASLTTSVATTNPYPACGATTPALLQPTGVVQFMGKVPGVFKPLGGIQNIPGKHYYTESGFTFDASDFPDDPEAAQVGVANFGTRLVINLSGLSSDAQVYFPLQDALGQVTQTSSATGPLNPASPTSGIMLEQTINGVSTTVPVTEVKAANDGTGMVTYEYTGPASTSSNSSNQTVTIPLAVICNGSRNFTITAGVGFGNEYFKSSPANPIPAFSGYNLVPNGNNFVYALAEANNGTTAVLSANATAVPVTQIAGSSIPTFAAVTLTANPAISDLNVNVADLSVPAAPTQVSGSEVTKSATAPLTSNGGAAVPGPKSSVAQNPAITAFLSSTTTPSVLNIYINGAGLNAGTATATIQVSDSSGDMVSIPVSAFVVGTPPVIGSVDNGASFAQGAVAGQEIVSLFGTSIGPSTGTTFALTSSASGDAVAPDTGGVEVYFDQYAGSVLYAGQGQINVTVPTEIAGQASTNVVVVNNNNGTETAAFNVSVAPASPAVFQLTEPPKPQAAALNQDGTVNGTSNPAAGGTYIVLFATGFGATTPPVQDGAVNPTSPPFPMVQGVSVMIGGQQVVPAYAGAAPGLVSGVYQVNAKVPTGLTSPAPVTVTVNGVTSPTVYIAVE